MFFKSRKYYELLFSVGAQTLSSDTLTRQNISISCIKSYILAFLRSSLKYCLALRWLSLRGWLCLAIKGAAQFDLSWYLKGAISTTAA